MTPTGGLSHRASRGAMVTASGLWLKTLIQLGSTMLLARLLDPADFGLVAMVMAIVGVADLVRDFGMTGAILQARSLTPRQWSGLMWFSVLLGGGLMVAVAASAPLLAALYREDRLIVLTLAIAPTLLINGIAMPMQARVQRELRFGTLAQIDVVAMALGVALSIVAALLGWGVWSLVVLAGSGQIYRLIALWIAAKPPWERPRLRSGIRPFVTTGGSIFGVQLLNYAARNLDNVVIGQQLGPAALGQYSRAYALFLLPQQQLTAPLGRVALPVLASLQDDPDRYRRYVRGSLTVLGYLSLPTYAIASAVAAPLMLVLLGPGWDQAAQVFALLAIAGAAQGIGNVQGWLYITLGRAHRQLVYFLITKPIVIALFFVGIWWNGLVGLALLYGLATVLVDVVPGFAVAIRGTFVRGWADVAQPLLRPLLLVPFAYAAAVGAVAASAGLAAPLQVVAGGLAGVVVMAGASLLPPFRRDYRMMFDFVRQARTPRRAQDAAPAADTPVDAEAPLLGATEPTQSEVTALVSAELDEARKELRG
ncbi:lipopolysaccharide biosynthesis protein [Microbacterium ulmi]|uniref:Lipopolysaccharide biosynthesis protein n=1 Tax=Microbacterium ulmi TaxID=179095 RepID=A0A7Y2Q0J4_9MICO|nr:lipopolysaccharide biosynthesis protein [Microbacterium ulmi]NII69460.1 PST family polysaccharide transporter [Microbacterium ulmi]NNH04418.1 lipopolysaccharide biosynthesis protein [Microbacterium ulmi]